MAGNNITADDLRSALNYDSDTGTFLWKKTSSSKMQPGSIAGHINVRGYVQIIFLHKHYMAHRLAWLFHYGEMPLGEIDHINGVRSDNRIENLRDVTSNVNQQNRKRAHRNNKLMILGVFKKGDKFTAQIGVCGKKIRLGLFSTPEAAHNAYIEAKRKLHIGNTL